MAPDGQVRLQASGIRLDHSLQKPVSEGEPICRGDGCAMDLELKSEGSSGGPTSVCSDQLFDACGAELVLDLPHGGVVGRVQPRTSSIAQLSERLRARQKARVEVPELHGESASQSPFDLERRMIVQCD
jgi:hypothetical protein